MRRRTRQLLVAAAAAVALAAAVGLQIRHEHAGLPQPLTRIDAAAVTTVGVRCRGCVTRRFEKAADGWHMREPYALPADAAAVEGLLAIAAVPVRTWYADGALDPSRLGLDPPLIELQLDAQRIAIGTTDVIDSDRYLGVDGRIARAPDRFSPRLLTVPEAELDRHLAPRGRALRAVDLIVGAQRRSGDAQAWRQAQAQRIDAPQAGIDASAASAHVQLHTADGETIGYRLLRRGDAYLALRDAPALIYVLDAATMAALLPDGVPTTP
ncbi:MAG: hypothetical protein DI564_08690 [Rhodanobacter denitrificans]|uniref:DUF4340 domain-containing protein n=1 Tax=Rhodanobacter denitrificans TaxID=666685 RepID=A0A2W5KEW2_9GAMM|nr:MAG: hypothetical protein DI564_08690 [Rhodanobacter denitrificans]